GELGQAAANIENPLAAAQPEFAQSYRIDEIIEPRQARLFGSGSAVDIRGAVRCLAGHWVGSPQTVAHARMFSMRPWARESRGGARLIGLQLECAQQLGQV